MTTSTDTLQDMPQKTPRTLSPWGSALILVCGVALPLSALAAELLTGMCAELVFDPIPTIGLCMLVALVPGANLLAWLMLAFGSRKHLRIIGLVNIIAIFVASCYTLVFVPFLPLTVMALFYIVMDPGCIIALLALAPLTGLICAVWLRVLMRKRLCGDNKVPMFWFGFVLSVVLFFAAQTNLVTMVGLRLALSSMPAHRTEGIKLLRTAGNEDAMLRRCYSMPDNSVFAFVDGMVLAGSGISNLAARDIYFRVTGDDFTTKPPPHMPGPRRGGFPSDFDWYQGTDTIGPPRNALTLDESKMDGSVDAHSAVAYIEWTMAFRNDGYDEDVTHGQDRGRD